MKGHRTAVFALAASILFASWTASADGSRAAGAVTSIRFDQRRAADLLERYEGRVTLSDLLRRVASVDVRAEAKSRLVLHVYQMRGRDVVRRYTSSPFDAPFAGSVPLQDVLDDGEPGFGRFTFEAKHLLQAVEPVPVGEAVAQPGRFIIDGVIPYHPKGWERMASFYFVAAPVGLEQPSDSRNWPGWPTDRSASAYIGVAFGMPVSRSDD